MNSGGTTLGGGDAFQRLQQCTFATNVFLVTARRCVTVILAKPGGTHCRIGLDSISITLSWLRSAIARVQQTHSSLTPYFRAIAKCTGSATERRERFVDGRSVCFRPKLSRNSASQCQRPMYLSVLLFERPRMIESCLLTISFSLAIEVVGSPFSGLSGKRVCFPAQSGQQLCVCE